MLRHDSGSAEGKSASFAKLLPGEMAEVYFYYAVPESLTEQPLTLQFTIGGQTYSYEIPADKSAALAPTAPEEAEPNEEPENTEQITLQEPPKQEETKQGTSASVKQEQADPEKTEKPKEEKPSEEESSAASRAGTNSGKIPASPYGYTIDYYDAAGRVEKHEWYEDNGQLIQFLTYEYDNAGKTSKITGYGADGSWGYKWYYENGRKTKSEARDGSLRIFKYEWSDQYAVLDYLPDGTLRFTEYYNWYNVVQKVEYPDGTVKYYNGAGPDS